MKHLKTYEGLFDFWKKKSEDSNDVIESKTEDMSYMLADIFDDFNIQDENRYYEQNDREPFYNTGAYWVFGRYAHSQSNPIDRIIIQFGDHHASYYVVNRIKEIKENIESYIGYKINMYVNKQPTDFISQYYSHRIVLTIKHNKKLISGGSGDTGPG